MTIPAVDMVVAVGLLAAIGPITRFDNPERPVAYLDLNPTVHQSGEADPGTAFVPYAGPPLADVLCVQTDRQVGRDNCVL